MRIINATLHRQIRHVVCEKHSFRWLRYSSNRWWQKAESLFLRSSSLNIKQLLLDSRALFWIWADLLARTRGWKPEGGLHSDLRVKLFLSPFRATWVKTGADTRTVVVGTKMIGISMVDGLRHSEETSGFVGRSWFGLPNVNVSSEPWFSGGEASHLGATGILETKNRKN